MCLAPPAEIATHLGATAKGWRDKILLERKEWSDGARAAGTANALPDAWRLTEQRLEQLTAGI